MSPTLASRSVYGIHDSPAYTSLVSEGFLPTKNHSTKELYSPA